MTTEEERFSPKFLFSTKWERLDWKRIASLDIEKIVATGNTEVLEDLICQIAHCRPDSEFNFDSDTALDSGFIKVFRFSQLIIQYLCFSLDRLKEKHKQLLDDLAQTQGASRNKSCEIQNLKDTLTQAKKELRRRKELLVSVQNEVIGENKDEFDPCPYCSKKFMTSSYLLSHMHRRHQGLPVNPVFPSKSMYQIPGYPARMNEIPAATKSPVSYPCVTSFTQTDHELSISLTTQNTVIDYTVVHDLVEKCLVEKQLVVSYGSDEQIKKDNAGARKEDRQIQTNLEEEGEKLFGLQSETEMTVANLMTEIKGQLDLQLKYISTKLEQAVPIAAVPEPVELQVSLVVQDDDGNVLDGDNLENKVAVSSLESSLDKINGAGQQLQLLEVTTDAVEMELCGPASPLQVHVNEQLQKQKADLQTLKTDLQAKMDTEINIIEGKLEAQERFWRSRLKQVKEEYDNEVAELRTDFQKHLTQLQDTLACQRAVAAYIEHPSATSNPIYGSIQNLLLSQNPKKQEEGAPPEVSPIKTISTKATEISDTIYHSTPRGRAAPTSFYKQSLCEEAQNDTVQTLGSFDAQPSPIYERKGSFRPSPGREVTAPRPSVSSKVPVPKPRGTPDPVIFIQSRSKDGEQSAQAVTHEYAEPTEREDKSHDSESCSHECDSESSELNEHQIENRSSKINAAVKTSIRRTSLDTALIKSVTSRRNSLEGQEEPAPRKQKNPEENRAKVEPFVSELQFRAREPNLQENIREERVKTQLSEPMPGELPGQETSRDIMGSIPSSLNLLPKVDQGRSPFIKIFAAVKSSGKKVQKTMKHAMGAKQGSKSARNSPTLAVPKSKSKQKPGFFSKARWGKMGKNGLNARGKNEVKSQIASSGESSETSPRGSIIEVERECLPRIGNSPGHRIEHGGNETDSSKDSGSETCSDSESLPKGTPHHRKNSKINRNITNAPKTFKFQSQVTKSKDEPHERPGRNPFLVPATRTEQRDASPVDVRRSSVRRSLLQEFQEQSPRKHSSPMPISVSKEKQESSDETDLDSSWDEESIQGEPVVAVKAPKLVAEYSEIKPNRFKPVQQVALEQSDQEIDTVKRGGEVRSPKGNNGMKAGQTVMRPVTARPRVVVDSWDTEDSSRQEEPVPMARNDRDIKKKEIIGQFPAKSQMYTINNVNSTKTRVQNPKNSRESPLNNSWDSG